MLDFGHLKQRCAGCEREGVKMNKEHVFPQWLIRRTGTDKTGIRWGKIKKLPALSVTLPLCIECNKTLGNELEGPVSRIFEDLEQRKGISDNEAELLVRWLWKVDGLLWIARHPEGSYTFTYTLRERVLRAIDSIRGRLILAISLIKDIDPVYGDQPLGLDSGEQVNAIFVSGVFSKVAMMVVLDSFSKMIPKNFSQYQLCKTRNAISDGKFFHPKVGFKDDTEAVGVTKLASTKIAQAHDELARKMQIESK